MSNFTWFLALKDLRLGSFKSVHTVHSLILFSVLFLDSFSTILPLTMVLWLLHFNDATR